VLGTPLTLLTEIFIPSLRVLTAKRLREMGMSQTRIANLIGVTQPAVRQYLDEDESKVNEKLIKLGLSQEEINNLLDQVTDLLTSEDVESVMSFVTVSGLRFLSKLKFCQFHRSVEDMPPTCKICAYIYSEDEELLMREALAMMKKEYVSELIPQVMSNLAFAKRGAKELRGVIAVPGRITKVHGVPMPASRPEWGASAHLAKILLAVMEKRKELRAVMNVKYDRAVEEALRNMGLPYVKLEGGRADDDGIAGEIASTLGNAKVAIYLGPKWMEPATYIFGEDPLEVARMVLALAKEYLSSRYSAQTSM